MKSISKETRTILLAATIPALLLLGGVEFILYKLEYPTFVIGLLGGGLIGICLSQLGRLFLRFNRSIWWLTIGQILAITVVGIAISFVIEFSFCFFPHENWVKTEPFPETVDHIVPLKFRTDLWVQGKSGTVYEYVCDMVPFSGNGCKWEVMINPVERDYPNNIKDEVLPNRFYFSLPHPGRSVQEIHAFEHAPDAVGAVKFVRLENGDIYYWYRMWSPYEMVYRVYVSLPVGLIISISTNITVFKLRKRKTIENIEPNEQEQSQ